MQMMKIVLTVALILRPCLCLAGGYHSGGQEPAYAGPITESDMVVRGKVVGIKYGSVSSDEWYGTWMRKYVPSSPPVDVVEISLVVDDVLRGNVKAGPLVVIAGRPVRAHHELLFNERVKIGKDVIIAGAWWPRAVPGWRLRAIFSSEAGGWSQLEAGAWLSPLPDDQLRKLAKSQGIDAATGEADVILLSQVVSARLESEFPRLMSYVVRPITVIKGPIDGNVSIQERKSDGRQRSSTFGFDLQEGREYYLFLRSDGTTLIPAVGRRSALLIDGDRIYEREMVPTSLTRRSLEREIRQAMSN